MPSFRHRWALPQPLPEKADAEGRPDESAEPAEPKSPAESKGLMGASTMQATRIHLQRRIPRAFRAYNEIVASI